MRAAALALLLLAASALGAQNAPAPAGRCKLVYVADHSLKTDKLPSGQFNAFTGGNVVARCPAQGLVLKSDSLESYGDEGRIVFIGRVDYSEPRLKLKSEQLTYFQRDERVVATQNVNARLPSGSTLRGPQLEFFRAVPRIRPQQSAIAAGRPTIDVVERDPQGRAQPPVTVTANVVYLQGDSIVIGQGQVVVVRPELTATGDSLYLDSGSGLLRIMRQPRIVGTKDRPFTLVGETIDLLSRQRKLNRVISKNAAEAVSQDLKLQSDSIDMRVANDRLQRAVAWGKSRAHATSATQSLVSDSIDVSMPNQRVREMHAVRRASAEATPDTLKFRATEKDRLTGDTIVARFDTMPAPAHDTSNTPHIRELVAMGNATSLQHLPPRDTTLCRPAINYVRGRVITVTFDSSQVSKVTVINEDKAGGLYLEPNPDSTATCRRTKGAIATKPAASAPPPTPPPASVPIAPPPLVAAPKRP